MQILREIKAKKEEARESIKDDYYAGHYEGDEYALDELDEYEGYEDDY